MKKQIIVIHGGRAWKTYEEYLDSLLAYKIDWERIKKARWKENLQNRLGLDFEVVCPEMPSGKWNAKYVEWKIWFEKLTPYFEPEVVLVGHSMGGIFLAKYLAENVFPKKIRATFLVAAPSDDKEGEYDLVDFALPADISRVPEQAGKIVLIQSEDDPVVPFTDLKRYQNTWPGAETRIFKDKGHFGMAEFPELEEEIRALYHIA